MGHKHSKISKRLKSIPEVTEIIELTTDNCDLAGEIAAAALPPADPATSSNNNAANANNAREPVAAVIAAEEEEVRYPVELKRVIDKVETVQRRIEEMSESQIDLYFANLKDELHDNWQRVYNVIDTSANVKRKKIEVIERIKSVLRSLNDHYLKKKTRRTGSWSEDFG